MCLVWVVEHAKRIFTVVADEPQQVGYWLCPVFGIFRAELVITPPSPHGWVEGAWRAGRLDDWDEMGWNLTHTDWEFTLGILMQRFVVPHMRSCIDPPPKRFPDRRLLFSSFGGIL